MKFAFQNGIVHFSTLNILEVTAKTVKKFQNNFYIILQLFFKNDFFLEILPISSVKSSFLSLIMYKNFIMINDYANFYQIYTFDGNFFM